MPYYGQLLFALQSFDNNALYHRNGKASAQFLVRTFALALIELNESLVCQIQKLQNWERAQTIADDLAEVELRMEAMGLTRQVRLMVDTIEKEQRFAANNHL